MSTEQKVSLADQAKSEYGLCAVLAAVELPRSTWYYQQKHRRAYTAKYDYLRNPLESIARQNPEYGYRRTTVELRENYGHKINHKVVQKLHQAWDLPLLRSIKPPKPSGIRQVITAAGGRINLRVGKSEIGIFEVVYTDFTELVYANGRRKAYLIPIIDHASKIVLGWAVGERAVTELALKAWERAKRTLKEQRAEIMGLIVHQDQDPVFTSYRWVDQLLVKDRARVSYSLNGARGNTEMESFNSRFKTENRSLLLDTQTLKELEHMVGERMGYYNGERRHSTIGYRAPVEYIATQWRWS